MGEHLWHRVAEWGQPPRSASLALARQVGGGTPFLVYPPTDMSDGYEWCVVDLPTEYAPAPLRNGWRAIETAPRDREVLVVNDRGGQTTAGVPSYGSSFFRQGFVAWMPLPAGPYDPEPYVDPPRSHQCTAPGCPQSLDGLHVKGRGDCISAAPALSKWTGTTYANGVVQIHDSDTPPAGLTVRIEEEA